MTSNYTWTLRSGALYLHGFALTPMKDMKVKHNRKDNILTHATEMCNADVSVSTLSLV